MRGKAANVLDAFIEEAELAFSFLASEFGLAGPSRDRILLPGIAFTGSGLWYRIRLDTDDKIVETTVEKTLDKVRLVAELEQLVSAVGLGAPNHVASSAHTVYGLRRALESQANYEEVVPRVVEVEVAVPCSMPAGW